jgi:hypothetical protein
MIVDTNGLSAWWINEPIFIRHIEQADRWWPTKPLPATMMEKRRCLGG